jgi:hypothetical protein
MTSNLDNLSGPGKPLATEAPDQREFEGLKRSGLARLSDVGIEGLSLEGRFDLAYNASHALCLAALRSRPGWTIVGSISSIPKFRNRHYLKAPATAFCRGSFRLQNIAVVRSRIQKTANEPMA